MNTFNRSQKGMSHRFEVFLENAQIYGLWLTLAGFSAWTGFQVRATINYLAVLLVENEVLRPKFWTTGTITSLDRLTILILGILWLGAIIFFEGFLREGQKQHALRSRSFFLFAGLGTIFLSSYLVLLIN